jgi:hypothetical protein
MNEATVVDSPVDMPLFSHKLICDTRPQSSTQSLPSLETAGRDIANLLQDLQPEYAHDYSEGLMRMAGRPAEDLENLLFILARDYYSDFSKWTFSLSPLLSVHPLICLFPTQPPKIQARLELKLASLLENDPAIMQKYRWTVKALDAVSKLGALWGYFVEQDFKHREDLTSCLLKECADLKARPVLVDAVYLAASTVEKDSLLTGAEERQLAEAATLSIERIVTHIVTLNAAVNFAAHKSILDYLYTGGRSARILPEQTPLHTDRSVQSKQEYARTVGFHVLQRPSFWSRCCRQTATQRANQGLERMLSEAKTAYLRFERSLAAHPM